LRAAADLKQKGMGNAEEQVGQTKGGKVRGGGASKEDNGQ